eukprot:EG_transcript_21996
MIRSQLLCVLLLLVPSTAYYFHLDQIICLADEVGFQREPAHVHYQLPDMTAQDKAAPLETAVNFVHATVSDPENNVIHHEVLKSSEGSFSFISTGVAGEYHICFEPSQSFADKTPKLVVEVESGSKIDYSKVQTKDDLWKVDRALQDLKAQMLEVREEMQYVIQRQVPFQATSESTLRRVWVWSTVQVLILVVMGAWQILNLKSFFLAKKLV